MKKTDIAYIAGIMDGEGCIHIKRHTKEPATQYTLQITVGSTQEWLCRYLQFSFGGSVRQNLSVTKRIPPQKPFWVWRVSAALAYNFLKIIYPYLHLKREQARIALEFQEARKQHRNLGQRPNTEEEIALQEVQRILVKGLKK